MLALRERECVRWFLVGSWPSSVRPASAITEKRKSRILELAVNVRKRVADLLPDAST